MKHNEEIGQPPEPQLTNTAMVTRKKSMKLFTLLLSAQLISSIGSGLTDFGLAIYVLAFTGSVTAASLVSICAFLPSILLAPAGGVLADHYDRRLMMIAGELLSGLGLIICLVTIMSGHPSLAVICIGVGISSVFSALMEPAFKATITDLLSEEDYAKAGGLVQIAGSAKLLLSPALAGLLLMVTSVSTLIIIDILTFFTTVGIISIVKKGMVTIQREKAALNFRGEMRQGLAAIRGKNGIVALIAVMTVSVFCLGFVQILSKPLILAFAGEAELGILTTVIAMGLIVGSGIVSLLKQTKSYGRMLWIGLLGCGCFLALMGLRANIGAVALFGFLMFVFMPAVQIGAEVLIRKNLAAEVQGRAFGLIGFITQLGYIAAYLLSGLLSDYVFEPFMQGTSRFARGIGSVIGSGAGRGNALLIMLAGIALALVGLTVSRLRSIKTLEEERTNEPVAESCPQGL